MAIPDWAQEGMTVAIKPGSNRSNWYTGKVIRTTSVSVYVQPANQHFELTFRQQRGDGWMEYGGSAYSKAHMYRLDHPVAVAGLQLARRQLAVVEAKREVQKFIDKASAQITTKDAEDAITALSHLITFIKATEASAGEGEA